MTKAWEPTDAQVEAVSHALKVGVPMKTAVLLAINPDTGKPVAVETLKKRFPDGVIPHSVATRTAEVFGYLSEIMDDANHKDRMKAIAFYLERVAGFTHKQEHRHGGLDSTGEPTDGIPLLIVQPTVASDNIIEGEATDVTDQQSLPHEK